MKKDRKYLLFAIAFLTLFAIGLYLNSLNNSFHFDDLYTIVENPHIRDLKDISLFLRGFGAYSNWNRLLPTFSFALNYHFRKLNVFGYHLVNLMLHILSGILVFFISRYLLILGIKKKNLLSIDPVDLEDKGVNLLSLFVAAIFISHPIQVNTVTYIVERIEGMACFFYLLCFFLFIKTSLSKGRVYPVRNSSGALAAQALVQRGIISNGVKMLYGFGTGMAFLFAIFSKEISFTLPITLILFDLMFACKNREMIKKRLIIYLGAGFLLILYLLFFLKGGIFTILVRPTNIWTPWENLLTQTNVIIQYFKLLVLPLPQWLNVDHDFQVSKSLFQYPTWISIAVILLLLGSAIILTKKNKIISFSIFFFFIVLLPTSSVIPIQDIMVEYRLYLPLFSCALLLSLGLFYFNQLLTHKFPNKLVILIVGGISILILSFYSVTTIERNKIFKNGLTLWTDAVKKSPNKMRPKINLISGYIQNGLYDQAIATSLEALKREPQNFGIYNKLGVSYMLMREYDKAIENFKTSIQINNNNPQALNNLGVIYLTKKDPNEAIAQFKQAISFNPHYAEAYSNLANALVKMEQLDEAIEEGRKAVKIDPATPEYRFNLAKLYENKGLIHEAVREYKEALKIDPNLFETHQHLGILYSKMERHREAIREFEEAIKINPNSGKAYFMLGVNFLKLKDRGKAIYHLEKALSYATNEEDRRAIESVLSRLRSAS